MQKEVKKDEPLKVDLSWAAPNVPCWVDIMKPGDKDGECYNKASVAKVVSSDTLSIKYDNEPTKTFDVKGDKVFPTNNYASFPDGYNDMVDMESLSEAELLYNLEFRFRKKLIFTYVGPTLIVLNPFEKVDFLFTPDIEIEFQKAVAERKLIHKDHQPHIYAIAASTMCNMFEFGTPKPNQAIVIAGESGAGKTENTKFCMNFLTGLGKDPKAPVNKEEISIGTKILACNPILEAFGNAKTTRNDNSSRFGKYVSLLVDKKSQDIGGATIKNYLLEKSRVVSASSKERNYHAYYHLITGASDELLKTLGMTKDYKTYNFLKNTFLEPLKTVDDKECYDDVVSSFKKMEFSSGEVNAVWSYTASSLHLGNLEFDGSKFDETSKTPCGIKDERPLKLVAELLKVDYDALSLALRTKTITDPQTKQAIQSPIKLDECNIAKDSLAKDLYNKLFDWLVKRLNYTTIPSEFLGSDLNVDAVTNDDKFYHVGLLDIFGFEILEPNSLEQLCINFTNEKLQQLYIEYVFNSEKKEFKNEGLGDFIGELRCEDNKPVIDLLDNTKTGSIGIFQMIDDASAVATATEDGLRNKIIEAHNKVFPPPDPKKYRAPNPPAFIIKHTACPVEYQITGFKTKNKDELSKPLVDCLSASKDEDIGKVWKFLCKNETEKKVDPNAKPNPKEKFLGYKFVIQMKDLYNELDRCSCHFVRCIKPNPTKTKGILKQMMTLEQIKYMGILDTIRVRKDSYPVRRLYKLFYQRYEYLHPTASSMMFEDHEAKGSDFLQFTKDICKAAVPSYGQNQILYGNTRIFLRLEAVAELERIRDLRLKKTKEWLIKFQRAIIYKKARKKLKVTMKNIKLALNVRNVIYRSQSARKEFIAFQKRLKALKKIKAQSVIYYAREQIKDVLRKFTKIQAWWRMLHFKKKYKLIKQKIRMLYGIRKAAIAFGKEIRVIATKKIVEDIVETAAEFLTLKIKNKAAIEIQRWVRGHLTRCKYFDEVEKIRKAKQDIIFNKNVKILQRNVRGWIVRSILSRLGAAAGYIQGFMKMKWLSTMFRRLRGSSIKIQRAVRAWLARKHAIQERLQEYVGPETNEIEEMQNAEQMLIFGPVAASRSATTTQRDTFSGSRTDTYGRTDRTEKTLGNRYSATERTSITVTSSTSGNPKSKSGWVMTPSGLVKVESNKNSPEQEKGGDRFSSRRETEVNNDTTQGSGFFSPEVLEKLNSAREITPYSAKKFNLFTKVIDFDMMCDLSDVYEPLWGLQILTLQHECCETEADVQIFDIGETHSVAIADNNKVYTFGWNDNFQLGRETNVGEYIFPYQSIVFPTENFRPKSVAVGENHNLLLDYAGNLYVWGDNSKGQLGIGNTDYCPKISILDFLIDDQVTQVRAKGHQSLAITKSGKAYFWPLALPTGEVVAQPIELSFPIKTQIVNASCGYDFTILVSKAGHIFSFGRDNKVGQLGHGDLNPREVPTLVESIKAERVTYVSCGYKHVVCKTSLGKVYTWGWGEKGQLGHGKLKNETTPKLVEALYPNTKDKILMVQAGHKHTLVLLETKRILWWGSTTGIKNQATPTECDLYSRIPSMSNDFTPVRVLTAWSKTMSVSYLSIADSRTTELQPVLKQKILSQLSAKYEEGNVFNDVFPPFVDPIAKYFPMKLMMTFNPLETMHSPTKEAKLKQQAVKLSPTKPGSKPFGRSSTGLETTTGGPQYSSLLKSLRSNPPQGSSPYQNQEEEEYEAVNYSSASKKSPIQKSQTSDWNNNMKITPSKSSPIQYQQQQSSPSPQKRQDFQSYASGRRESPTKNDPTMKPEVVAKLREIKKKVEVIARTPKSKWTTSDIEFMKMASQPHMMEVLKKIQI